MPEDWESGGFGVYVHWPFCMAKCPYCDFNSHVSQYIDQKVWADAYVAEIARLGAETSEKTLRSVFFGGGTPSLMEPKTVQTVLDAIRRTWRTTNDIEITLEANPTSVEATRFAGYAAAGVNRLSMGVQALNDADLKALGRMHSADEAMRAFDVARNQFSRVSFDLIYARQGQTPQAWEAELGQALTMAVDHLSLYQLTIEEGTAFGDRYRAGKLRGLPSEDAAADLWDITQGLCDAAGFGAYEVSNHAKPGQSSLHNLIYWRYGDYAGIGPGAHGRLTLNGQRYATEGAKAPGRWLEDVRQGTGENLREPLSNEDAATEFLLMGLRLTEGVEMSRYDWHCGARFDNQLRLLEAGGFLERFDGRLRATTTGRPVLNSVLSELMRD